MTIAITGATGQLGRLVLAQLQSRAPQADIVALARNPGKAEGLGVPVREADYDRPETLGPALAGIETLLLISASEVGKRVPQHQAVIDAAKVTGVKRIVYTSLLHAPTSGIGLAEEHRATEAYLAASGLEITILRNGWYTENYAGALGGALHTGAIIGSAGTGRISAATRADYAEAAAVAVLDSTTTGQVFELAGDTAFTMDELAQAVAKVAGKPVVYQDLPVADYAKALAGMGLPEGLAQAIAGWDVAIAQGALFDDSHTLSRLIGRPTADLDSSVRALLA